MTNRTPVDIDAMQASIDAVEAAMQDTISYLKNTEEPTSEAAHDLIDRTLAEHGCESPEGHIVAAGAASHEPHEKGAGLILEGVPIVIDIFPRSKTTGWWADMTRTICLGRPSEELQQMYDAVLAVHEASAALLRPGVRCREIQQAAAEQFVSLGYKTTGKGTEFPFAEGYVHGLGHGVGQEIHQAPFLNLKSDEVLQVGDVITIEPGLYYKHIGGVRLEDMYLITKSGATQLTTLSRQLHL